MEICLKMQEVISAMMMVGLVRVLRFGFEQELIPEKFKEEVKIKDYEICFPKDLIPYLLKAYLYYAIQEFDRVKILQEKLTEIAQNIEDENTVDRLNQIIKEIEKVLDDIDVKITAEMDKQEILTNIDKIIVLLNDEGNKEKINMNYIKRTILFENFEQASFLNGTYSKLCTINENLKIFQKYAEEVLREIELQEEINGLLDKSRTEAEELAKKVYFFITEKKRLPKDISADPYSFLKDILVPCPIVEGLFASVAFEEKHFAPFGSSIAGGINFGWNNKPSIYISRLAAFLMWFIPFSCAKKYDFETEVSVYSFVMSYQPFKRVLATNDMLYGLKDEQVFTALSNVLAIAEAKAEATLNNSMYLEYSVVKVKNKKKIKSKVYCFNIKTYMAKFFSIEDETKKELRRLSQSDNWHHQRVVEEIAKAVFLNQPILPLLEKELKSAIADKRFCLAKPYILSIKKLKQLTEGGHVMELDYNFFYKEGNKLFENLKWDPNKVSSYVQKLFSKVHFGDKEGFFAQVMKLYTAAKLPIPPEFLKIFEKDEDFFGAIAYNFLAGLHNAARNSAEIQENIKEEEIVYE